jgi:hypothetical protein
MANTFLGLDSTLLLGYLFYRQVYNQRQLPQDTWADGGGHLQCSWCHPGEEESPVTHQSFVQEALSTEQPQSFPPSPNTWISTTHITLLHRCQNTRDHFLTFSVPAISCRLLFLGTMPLSLTSGTLAKSKKRSTWVVCTRVASMRTRHVSEAGRFKDPTLRSSRMGVKWDLNVCSGNCK